MKKKIFKNKTILISGGTGSIGSAVVEEILKHGCKTLRVLSNDENSLHDLSLKIKESSNFFDSMKKNKIRYIYGDITDQNRVNSACEDVDIIIHAAAMKHVPICEYNPFEATKVNVIGTENMIKASLKNKVKKFILISTDKVVDPTTCLGATKLLAEKITLNSNLNKGNKKISFSVVRFGNVIGTRGSALPKFIYQFKNNQKITLTDKDSTRFFVTKYEAVNTIINATSIMKGGEIFLPKIVNAIKISDLVKVLSKYFSQSKSRIVNTGLRLAEKKHEKIITDSEYKLLRSHKNLIIIDFFRRNRFKKLNNNFKSFDSSKAKLLNTKEIYNYLKKNSLFNI